MAERYESGLDPCDDMLTFIKMSSGDINEYDIRKFGAPYNRTLKAAYLSQLVLRESLHIADLQPFVNCNNTVKDNLAGDILQSVVGLLPNLLRHMRVLLYGGQFDLKDGPLGTARYLETVNWEGRQSYLQAPRNLWLVNKSDSGTKASKVESIVGGYVKASGNLTFLVISGAGHFAPMDQRNNVLDMLRRFLADEPFCAARSQTAPQASSQDEASSPKAQARRRLYGWDGFSNERRQSGEDQQTCFLDDKLYCDLLQDCNKRGTCSGGRCKCQEGYTGTRCQHTQQQLSINEKVYESNIQALEWKYYFFYIAPTQIGTDSITFITLTGMRDGSSVQQHKILGLYLQAGKPPTERSFFASSRANTTRHFLSVQLEAGIRYTVGVFNTGASNSSFTLSLETLDTALLPSSSCEDEPSSSMAACSLWVDALLITLAVLGVLLIIFVAVVLHYRGKLKAQNSPFQELALPATLPTMADQDEDYDEGDIKEAKKLRLSRTEP
ncbi:Carboxypeptidase, variant 2 [Balamuthia mandrillaris]